MRSTAMLFATIGLGLTAIGCGDTSATTSSIHQTPSSHVASSGAPVKIAPLGSYIKEDSDPDKDSEGHGGKGTVDDDDPFLAAYGGKAGRAERQAVASVVKRYYAAAAAEEDVKACGLLQRGLASGLAEDASQSGQGNGKSCPSSLSHLFKEQHQRLVAEDASTVVVIGVRAKGDTAMAVLGFRAAPEGEILLQREGRIWKVDALFDSALP